MNDLKNTYPSEQETALLKAKITEYLASNGIVRENTTLVCFIDGAQRQPDLFELMFDFVVQKNKPKSKIDMGDKNTSGICFTCSNVNNFKGSSVYVCPDCGRILRP